MKKIRLRLIKMEEFMTADNGRILKAYLETQEQGHSEADSINYGYLWMTLDYLPDGAKIGDEFDLAFARR